MSIKSNIIMALKGVVASWKQVLLGYVVFPVLIVSCLGYFYKDIYNPKTNVDKINVTIIDDDNSESSIEFKRIFKSSNIKDIVSVTKNGQFIIKIPKGYGEKLAKLSSVTIMVSGKGSVSEYDENTIKSIISDYGKIITENKLISNKTAVLDEKNKQKIYDELNNIYSQKILENKFIKPKKTLNSYESLSASLINYIIVAIAVSIAVSYKKEKKDGIFKRLMSMPMKREKLFNTSLVCYFTYSTIFGGLYILGFIVTGIAFRGCNFINLAIILLCQSMLITSFSAFIMAFFSDEFSIPILMILLFFQTFFGETFVPMQEVSNSIYIKISKFAFLNIVSDAYKKCMIFNSFSSIEKNLVYMIIFSIVIYIIAFFKIKIGWETT